MFVKRLLSGIALLALAILFLYMGGLPLLLIVAAIAFIGQFELYRALGIEHKGLAFIGYMATAAYFVLVYCGGVYYMATVIVVTLIVLMTAYVATFPEYKTEEVTAAFFGMCYVPVMLSYLYLTRMLPDGRYFVWLILISSWGSDTLAYCFGMLFGKHKMVPKLSPKKSIEGAIGGVAGAMVLGAIFGYAINSRFFSGEVSLFTCSVACGIGAIISMRGDLAASAIKRNHGIKDYGDLIPGHGGVLDRFDSMLFTSPAVYFAVKILEEMI